MSSIFLTLIIFFTSFFFQLIALRVIHRTHIHVFASFSIYILGFIIVVVSAVQSMGTELPYTSILVYILLTMLLITFSFVPLLGLRTPSSLIMEKVQTERNVTFPQLEKMFDERKLILIRLNDLVDIGLVKKQRNRYVISYKGLWLARLVSGWSRIMGWKMQG